MTITPQLVHAPSVHRATALPGVSLKLIIALATIAFAFGVVIPITDIANTLFDDIPTDPLTALTAHGPASGTHQLCPPLCT